MPFSIVLEAFQFLLPGKQHCFTFFNENLINHCQGTSHDSAVFDLER